jgi:hypothetical protein
VLKPNFVLKILPCYTVGWEPEPEPHQNFYPEPKPHINEAAPQHGKKPMEKRQLNISMWI